MAGLGLVVGPVDFPQHGLGVLLLAGEAEYGWKPATAKMGSAFSFAELSC